MLTSVSVQPNILSCSSETCLAQPILDVPTHINSVQRLSTISCAIVLVLLTYVPTPMYHHFIIY
jgi:hypothetical protein